MPDDHLWTAEELEQLTPDERARVLREGIVTDLSELPAEFVERARARGRALLEAPDGSVDLASIAFDP